MGNECCSVGSANIDDKVTKFWEKLPIRTMSVVSYADYLLVLLEKSDITKQDKFEELIIEKLLASGDEEEKQLYKKFFDKVKQSYGLQTLLLVIIFLTCNVGTKNDEIIQAIYKISYNLNIKDVYYRENSKREAQLYAKKEYLERLVSVYINMVSALFLDFIAGVSKEQVNNLKQEYDIKYQDMFKEYYVIFQEQEELVTGFIEFNIKTLANDNEIRRKLTALYLEDKKNNNK
jgi:hypothetical protein